MQRPRFIFGLAGCLVLAACSNAPVRDLDAGSDAANLTEDQSRLWYAAENLEQTIRKRNLTFENDILEAYVQSVMDRLYPEFVGTLKVKLLDSPHLNAFCLPNGHIYFNTGLLARLDNEAQLATILAHEASHFIRQHSLRQRNSADGAVMVGITLTALTGIPLSGTLLTEGILSGYSRTYERQADGDGYARIVASGYDPREAAKTFKKLLDEVVVLEIEQPFLFSSHPKLQDRIDTFETLAREAPGSDGTLNAEIFLHHTQSLREFTLTRYLEMNNYKVLLLILGNEELRSRYTVHPDYFLGEAYRLRNAEGDAELAVKAFSDSTASSPDFAPAYRSMGVLLMKQGKNDEASTAFERYLALSPEAQDRAYVSRYLQRLQP